MIELAIAGVAWCGIGLWVGFYMGEHLEAKRWRENAIDDALMRSGDESYKVIHGRYWSVWKKAYSKIQRAGD